MIVRRSFTVIRLYSIFRKESRLKIILASGLASRCFTSQSQDIDSQLVRTCLLRQNFMILADSYSEFPVVKTEPPFYDKNFRDFR